MKASALTEAEREARAIECLCLGETEVAKFFFLTLDRPVAHRLLRSLFGCRVPQIFVPTKSLKGSVQYNWSIYCFLKWFDSMGSVELDWSSLVEREVVSNKVKPRFSFLTAFADANKSQKVDPIKIAKSFLKVGKEFHAYCEFWRPDCDKVFRMVPFEKLFESFGFNAFDLYSRVEMKDVAKITYKYTNAQDFEALFQVPDMWVNENGFVFIQNQIVMDNFYPNCVDYEVDKESRGLVETASVKHTHFVDLVRYLGHDLMFRDEVELSYGYAKVLGSEFAPWLFVCFVNGIEEKFEKFNAIVPEVLSQSTGILKDALTRVLNDSKFLADIKRYTGQFLMGDDLATKSFPKVMSSFLPVNPDPFRDFYQTPLLCVSDEDRHLDANFIWAAMALGSLIRVMDGAENMDELLDQNTWFLEQIDEPNIRQSILTDVFSLLFLRKGGKYVCQKQVAERILTTVLSLVETKELEDCARIGHLHLQVTQALISSTETIADLLAPKQQQLLEALDRHDWKIAEYIASLKKSDQDFVSLYRSVYNFKEGSTKAVRQDAAVEIAASFPQQPQIIGMALEQDNIRPEIKQFLLLRDKAVEPLKLVRTLKKQLSEEVDMRLTRMSAVKWPVPSFPKKKTRLKELPSFMSMLDRMITPLLGGKLAETVSDALMVQPRSVLQELLQNGQIQEATALANHLGKDLFDFILTDNSYPVSVLRHFTHHIPAVELASVFTSRQELREAYPAPNRVCERLMALKIASSEEDKMINNAAINTVMSYPAKEMPNLSMELAYRVNQDMIDEVDVWTLIRKYIEEGNADMVGELSFLVDKDEFSAMIMQRLSDDNIHLMLQICDRAAITAELSDHIDFLTWIQPDVTALFPLADAFRSLILQQKYLKASKFAELMHDKIDCFKVLLECLETSQDKLEILGVCPEMKEALLAKLGIRELDLDDAFTGYIPPEWRTTGSPEEILDSHISEDLETVVVILHRFPEINCDGSFVESLGKLRLIPAIVSQGHMYLPVCRDTSFVGGKLEKLFSELLSKAEIRDPESEVEALQNIIRVNELMKRFGETSFTKKLAVLASIISKFPLTKYNVPYTLVDLGASLWRIAANIDLVDEFNAMTELWHMDNACIVQEEYLLKCYQMCWYDVAMPIPRSDEFFKQIMQSFSLCHFYEPGFVEAFTETFPPDESMLNCEWTDSSNIRKAQSMMEMPKDTDKCRIRRLSCENYIGRSEADERSHFYPRIKALARRSTQPAPSHSHMETLYKIFFEHAPKNLVIRYYSSHSDFKEAMNSLSSASDKKTKLQLFKADVMEVAIANNTFTKLKVGIKDQQDLFKAILPVAGPTLRYDIELEFGMYRDACKSALDLYCNSRSTGNSLIYLDMAQQALERESRQTPEDVNLLTSISIQRLFNALVIDKHLDGYSGLHLFGSDKYKVAMVQLLIMENELDLAIAIIQNYNLSKGEIACKIVDAMLNEGDSRLVSFITSFEQKCKWTNIGMLFKELVYVIIMRLMYTLNLEGIAISSVRAVREPRFKCSLLIQFELFEEAAAIALEHQVFEFLPLILHHWQAPPKSVLFAKCMKALI